ncbi:MAG: RNA polymerase sigma factor [Pirellulales bacterium]|nr:RNA polymerase sigma factor [Pirellulales bacterium]
MTTHLAYPVADSTQTNPDADCVARILQGDSGAFTELITRHHEYVCGLARKLLATADVDDVVQAAYVAVLTNLPGFRQQSQYRTWLTQIVINQCRQEQRWTRRFWNWLRRAAGQLAQTQTQNSPSAQEGPDAADQTFTQLHAALEQLSPAERELVVLRYFDQHSSAQIGVLLNLTPNTVDSRLSRIRRKLRTLISELRALTL